MEIRKFNQKYPNASIWDFRNKDVPDNNGKYVIFIYSYFHLFVHMFTFFLANYEIIQYVYFF